MPAAWPWTQRRFTFDFPIGKRADILERYRGTPARLRERIAGLDRAVLTHHDAPGTWSILQNIGHLLDLEPLWERRLDDYLAGRDVLCAADMTNAATHAAGYDTRDARDLVEAFAAARGRVVARLEPLHDEEWSRVAIHPRLQQPMRLADAIAFTCDHDDYHLARITELIRSAVGADRG